MLKAIAKPKYIGLCIWAFRQLWWVDSRLKTLALDALNSKPNPGLPLTPELQREVCERVNAIVWTSKIHPVRPKCLHRSLALHQWLSQQGIEPQLEIGWQGKNGHAWVTYQGVVLNDRADIAEVTPRLNKTIAKTS